MHIFFPICIEEKSYLLQAQAQIAAITDAGHMCTVLCQPGRFADSIDNTKVSILLTDCTDTAECVQLAIQPKSPYTLVHAYPYQGRKIGLQVARHFGIPFILNIHTEKIDALHSYKEEVDLIIATNRELKKYLIQAAGCREERILVIPRGINTNTFHPASQNEVAASPKLDFLDVRLTEKDRIISVFWEFENSDLFTGDILEQIWNFQTSAGLDNILWVIGTGKPTHELKVAADAINKTLGRQIVTFFNGQNAGDRKNIYQQSTLSITTDHYTLESMACGTPTLAFGSRGYIGLIDQKTIIAGLQTSFTGSSLNGKDSIAEILCTDLQNIIYDEHTLVRVQKLSARAISTFFNQNTLNKQLLFALNSLEDITPLNSVVTYQWMKEEREFLSFVPLKDDQNVTAYWNYPDNNNSISIVYQNDGSVEISFAGNADDHFYLRTAGGGFHIPPPDDKNWRIAAGHNYKLQIPVTTCNGTLHVNAWIIEYNADVRLTETTQNLQNGKNIISFTPSSNSTRFRIAIRFSGNGRVIIAPLTLFKETAVIPPSPKYSSEVCSQSSEKNNKEEHPPPSSDEKTEKCSRTTGDASNTECHIGTSKIQNKTAPISVFLQDISLCYRRGASFFLTRNKHMREKRDHWALKNLTFTLYEGETVGLIGRNGSGKSTTSMVISGALTPDMGTIDCHGTVQLLALGIGFRPQLTGRENVMISGTILGMTRREIRAKMEEIREFAELGDFFDEPIRTYSAGMKSRLGFAVSTAVKPDILILDEVMSTGDAAFRNKANKRMELMRKRTKTVIIVSHSSAMVKELCDRVIWLEQGTMLMDGSPETIVPMYDVFCKNPDQWLLDHPETADLLNS